MEIRVFGIPANGSNESEAEMNRFLRGHRVLSIRKELISDGENSFWTFCVEYLDPRAGGGSTTGARNGKVDYKEVLKPREFMVYNELRKYRKVAAEREGIPVYSIFTNEQLAQMVRTQARSEEDLKRIEGVGEARVAKHASAILAILSEAENPVPG